MLDNREINRHGDRQLVRRPGPPHMQPLAINRPRPSGYSIQELRKTYAVPAYIIGTRVTYSDFKEASFAANGFGFRKGHEPVVLALTVEGEG
jgi:hypothetical protein